MEAEAKPKPTLQPLVNKQVLHVTPTDPQLPPFASSIDHPLTQSTQQNDLIKDEYEFEDDDDYLDSFPPGFRFCPRDDELILHYLTKKVMNEPLPQNRIMDVNLYLHNPETLAERFKQYGEKEWYFFTPRDKKYKNGTRPNRAAGDGYWKATGADKSIFHNKKIVGSRKALVFYKGKPPKGDKTNWIMHEYRVVDSPRSHKDMRLDDWVLCRIYKKLEKSNNKMMRTKDRSPSPSPTPPEETFDYSNEATNIDFDDGNNPYSLDYNAEDMGLMPQPSFYDPSFPNQFFSSGSTYQDEVWGAKNLDFPSQLNYFGVPRTDSLIGLENICSDASNKPFNNVNSRKNSQQQ